MAFFGVFPLELAGNEFIFHGIFAIYALAESQEAFSFALDVDKS
jgi:hypothetical protein